MFQGTPAGFAEQTNPPRIFHEEVATPLKMVSVADSQSWRAHFLIAPATGALRGIGT
jgi:hypothetical protein